MRSIGVDSPKDQLSRGKILAIDQIFKSELNCIIVIIKEQYKFSILEITTCVITPRDKVFCID